MQIDQKGKSKTLRGVTDLTLAATIRRELIPALDSRSYESRLRLLLRTLNALRISSLEVEPTPLISDVVDRIRAIHSFRLAIVPASPTQPRALLVLAVAFDGGWEPYMRRIWRDLGPLLDVIFCNCEDYLGAHDHSFAEYAGWVRSAQVETEFFYNASALTVNDLHYVRENERRRADRVRPPQPNGNVFEQALKALTALYRLTDMYPPSPHGLGDGEILLRAALHLLSEHEKVLRENISCSDRRSPTERAALDWFVKAVRREDKGPAPADWDPAKVQGGIVEPYEGVTHGCLLLVELLDAAAAQALLEYVRPIIINAGDQRTAFYSASFTNLSFTLQGLQVAGVPEATLTQLPFEFREGMAARAGILGDLLHNHPTCWLLPERNWPDSSGQDRVQMSSVHAIVQLACRDKLSRDWLKLVGNGNHPLWKLVSNFDCALGDKGVRILSVQAMQRYVREGEQLPRDHFGFVDGISQPALKPEPSDWKSKHKDQVMVGDLLLGYGNSLRDPPLTGRLWDDSTFLVVRKLHQDVEALNAVLPTDPAKADLCRSRMMGRHVNGENLIDGTTGNDFDYDGDPEGRSCPFQSHVRRANPRAARDGRPDLRTVPRIMRRGMSYGPLPDGKNANDDRGLVFMAYNASIAEQFEVIQSWLGGGNSGNAHTYSALRDPLMGVALDGDPRTFIFQDDNQDEERLNLASERPFVTLEWGVYCFVPSIKALGELQDIAKDAAAVQSTASNKEAKKKKEDERAVGLAMQASKGAAVIARLVAAEQALGFEAAKEQWKIALEDVSARMSGLSQCVWTAIRQLHGGVLRTPYGVLVCSNKLVMQVFEDRAGQYTATGYAERMVRSFGRIYLGMDKGPQYDFEAAAPNFAIGSITEREAFEAAFKNTCETIKRLVSAAGVTTPEVDVKDIVDGVLAAISSEWFGLPDEDELTAGGWHWRPDRTPTCPGHFHSPSRYMFQPNPGPEAASTGEQHGQALYEAVKRFVDQHRRQSTTPGSRLGRRLFEAIPDENERLARTLIGVMMGFLPTVDGNLRGTLYEWISDRSLWDLQLSYLADGGKDEWTKAANTLLVPLQRALLLRPVPELTWRIAKVPHQLGPVNVHAGDRMVLSIVSATQERLLDDDMDRCPIQRVDRDAPAEERWKNAHSRLSPLFGGNRDAEPHPTHACPGYKAAMGVMLGVLAGLMASAHMKPTMSPMALRLSIRS